MSVLRSTLVYDGDCGICRTWVDYWRALTGDRIDYRPYQHAASDFPDIPREAFASAVQLIEPDGKAYSGAAATYRVLAHAPGCATWWWLYRHLPGFASASEAAYVFLSRRRGLLARLTYLLWGHALVPARYELVSFVFLRLLGAIYVAAFASLAVQIEGLIGKAGILPLFDYLDAAHRILGSEAYWTLPTLFWLNSSDASLIAGTGVGILLGLLVILNLWVRAALAALFALYLSYVYAGQDFMTFQWDSLLLEVGFLAIFLTNGSRIIVWLYRWLVFRYFLLAGAAKVLSGDATWRDLTALKYHFWTQPLPTPLAWYAAQLPDWLLAAGTSATLLVETVCVFLVFLPRRLRAAGAWAFLMFEALIVLTGNYNFFNLLSMLMCIFLFDDAALLHVMPGRLASWAQKSAPHPGRGATAMATIVAIVIVPAGLNRLWETFTRAELPVAGIISRTLSPFLVVNPYGLFAVMTTTRPEIVIEGSNDGTNWTEYVFRYKPGPLDRPPSWNIPHQPRLDWQLWFAALGNLRANPWVQNLVFRLLEGSAPVLALLDSDPFPAHPPRFIRATLFGYRFADERARAATGQWWVRELEGSYFPAVSLADFQVMTDSSPSSADPTGSRR